MGCEKNAAHYCFYLKVCRKQYAVMPQNDGLTGERGRNKCELRIIFCDRQKILPSYRLKRFRKREVIPIRDEEIIDMLNRRDERGISAMRESYGRLLKSLAYGILRNEQDAEECESEALLRAWNSIPPEQPELLCAYLCRITRRLALDRYDYNHAAKRSGETLPVDELAEMIGGSSDAADRLGEKELTRLLNEFLSKQDRITRVIFMRRYWFGDTIAQTAGMLRASESMVKSRISRTLKRLREFLRKEGYDL